MSRRLLAGASAGAIVAGLAAAGPASAATIPVTNTDPGGEGSLVEASFAANNNPGPDTITFAPNVTGTIELTQSVNFKYDTTVDGPGSGVLTVDGPGSEPAVIANAPLPDPDPLRLTIEGLTITGIGEGAMRFDDREGSVTVRDSTVTGVTPGGPGGSISADGIDSLNVVDSVISGGEAEYGGGIFVEDTAATVTGTTFSGNRASQDGGAIAVFESSFDPRKSSLTVSDSTFEGSVAFGTGGAISLGSADGDVRIERSTITGSFTPGRGAGIYVGYTDGEVIVDSSTFRQNGSNGTPGGAMFVYAPKGRFLVRNSTITSNPGNRGGGIYWLNYYDTDGRIENSTIVGNSAQVGGGGIFRVGFDGTGPSYEGPDDLVISSSVVAGNTSPYGPDLSELNVATGSFILDHTLVGQTTPSATITQAVPGTNKLGAGDPGLAPLADNGGPTRTMLPQPTSPVLDSGASNGLAIDQRGGDRTADQAASDVGDGTDIGAVELEDALFLGADASAKRKQKQGGKKIVVAVQAMATERATATAGGTIKLGKKTFPLTEATAPVSPGAAATLRLSPASKKGAKKVAKLLKKGKKAKASVRILLTDEAGNAAEETVPVTLTGKKKKRNKKPGGKR